MTAKKKDNTGKQTDNNVDSELEKKVDAMMSVEEQTTPESPAPPTPIKPPTPIVVSSEPDVGSAPLLPNDKLPDLDKKAETPPPTPVPVPPQQPVEPVQPTSVTPLATELTDDLGLEDPNTSQAVDDIVASESDELLAVHDTPSQPTPPAAIVPKKKKGLLKRWWQSKIARNFTLLLLLGGIIAAGVVPTSRYFILNTFGVRSAASMTVLDEATKQPLKNVLLTIDNQSAKTDEEGNVRLENLKLGSSELTISKPAFAEIRKKHVFGWGSNPLGEFYLKAVGSQHKFTLVDFLSKQPISKATATSGEATARSNEKGEITLTVPQSENEKVEVQIKADGYRSENQTVTVSADPKTVNIEMVPARKHAFITKRSGTYDVYKADVDGRNEEKVLSGTGSERTDSMALSIHPSKPLAALISTRDYNRTINGSPVSTLTLINLSDNSTKTVAQSERLQMVDWVGDRLVYVKIGEGEKADSTTRHRLMSYDVESGDNKELASSNYFNAVVAAKNVVYYTPASFNVNGAVGLFKIGANGENKKTIHDKEVWSLFRTAYDTISASIGQDWFEVNLSNDAVTVSSAAPATQKSRIYVERPGSSQSLWVDDRDGKGVLLDYDTQAKSEKVLQQKSGLKYPVYWLDATHVIYRVSSAQETADYIFSIEGGEPRKIRDVTDTAGVDRWYYY